MILFSRGCRYLARIGGPTLDIPPIRIRLRRICVDPAWQLTATALVQRVSDVELHLGSRDTRANCDVSIHAHTNRALIKGAQGYSEAEH